MVVRPAHARSPSPLVRLAAAATDPAVLGWAVTVVALGVLAGWATGTEALVRLGASNPPVAPQAAVCFAISGFAVALHAGDRDRHKLLLVAGGLSFAVGIAHLAITLVDEPTVLDRLLFEAETRAAGVERLGRLSPTTCLGLSAIGITMVALARGERSRRPHGLAVHRHRHARLALDLRLRPVRPRRAGRLLRRVAPLGGPVRDPGLRDPAGDRRPGSVTPHRHQPGRPRHAPAGAPGGGDGALRGGLAALAHRGDRRVRPRPGRGHDGRAVRRHRWGRGLAKRLRHRRARVRAQPVRRRARHRRPAPHRPARGAQPDPAGEPRRARGGPRRRHP